VTTLRQLARPMMGRGTGLYADQARRQRREELHYLTAAKRLPDDHFLRCIDAMDLDTFLAISNPIVHVDRRRYRQGETADLMVSLPRRLIAEWLGTAFLLATVVGSGIMAEKLAGGNGAIALLCNTLPTGAILVVLILVFGPLSGAHLNPAVTAAFA